MKKRSDAASSTVFRNEEERDRDERGVMNLRRSKAEARGAGTLVDPSLSTCRR
jgi:hypothetical protein